MIEREIYPKLEKYMKKKEILALIGSRQAGKTTLMQQLYDNLKNNKKNFITFEEPKILHLFEQDNDDFYNLYVKNYDFLFIDEFQYAKNGGKKLKLLFDKYKIKIVISGSSAADLSIHSLSYLVGRVFVFEIYPLTFKEFLKYRNQDLMPLYESGINENNFSFLIDLYEEFLKYGGYPQVVIEDTEEEKITALNSLTNTYLLKEIRDVLGFSDSYEFEKLLKILAIKDSGILNKSTIASDIEITLPKLDTLLNILEKTFIMYRLRPLTQKQVKELIKSPKLYFMDLGFKNILVNNFNSTELRTDRGAIYESFILNELVKMGYKPKFYNYKNSSEVDFLIEEGGKTIGIEVKSKLSKLKIERGLRVYIEKYKPSKIYIFNLNIKGTMKVNNTDIIFTNHLNIYNIFKKD